MKARLGGIAAVATLLAAAPLHAEPAMWSVGDADSTIYLFGTAHAVRRDAGWKTARIDAAMRAATDLWLEIGDDLGSDKGRMAEVVQRLGYDPARPLSKTIGPAMLARLDAVLKPYGLTAAQLEAMRPWLAAVRLGTLPFEKAGLDPDAGADRTLRSEAVAQGDAVHGFETSEQQIRFLADLTEREQIAFLRDMMKDAAEGPAQLTTLATAWEKGDTKALTRIVVEDMRHESPLLYRRLIVQRNIAWAAQIRRMLAGKGTVFVAVGVGHLVGPDSVQAQLAKAGIIARRR